MASFISIEGTQQCIFKTRENAVFAIIIGKHLYAFEITHFNVRERKSLDMYFGDELILKTRPPDSFLAGQN